MKNLLFFSFFLISALSFGQYSRTLKNLPLLKTSAEKKQLLNSEPNKLSTYLSCEIYNLYFDREKLGEFKNILIAHDQKMQKSKRPIHGGAYWYIRGKYEEKIAPSKALKLYFKSADYFKKDKDTLGLIFTTYGISEANRYTFGSTAGDTSKTRKNLEQAILWAKKINSPEMEASGWGQLGSHNLSTSRNNNYLLFTSKKALEAVNKLKSATPTHIDVFINLSLDLRIKEEYKESKEYLDSAFVLVTNLYPNKWKLALCYQYLGILETEIGNNLMAEKYFLNSLDICDKEMIKEKYQSLQNLALFYNRIGVNPKKAFYYLDEAFKFQKEVFKERNSIELNELSIQYEIEKKEIENKYLQEKNKYIEKKELYYIYFISATTIGILGLAYLLLKLLKTNKKLSIANAEIEEFNRTRSYLFGIIAHDLLRPAQAISGVSTILETFIRRREWNQVQEVGYDLVQSANALQSQSENLIRWALAQKNLKIHTKEWVLLESIVEEVTNIFKLFAEWKKVKLQILGSSPVKMVYVDRKGLHLVIRNIIDNAIKASSEGDTVQIKINLIQDQVQLQIQDQGFGIPGEILEKVKWVIQNPYEHDKYLNEVGIGTVVIAIFSHQNNLKINVQSQPGQGTQFDILFPS